MVTDPLTLIHDMTLQIPVGFHCVRHSNLTMMASPLRSGELPLLTTITSTNNNAPLLVFSAPAEVVQLLFPLNSEHTQYYAP
jgi:hypothetical protein